MEELGKKQDNSRLYCDSESVIHLANNSAFHSKKNHKIPIEVPLHKICLGRWTFEVGKDTH
jgi:hypothetical protein